MHGQREPSDPCSLICSTIVFAVTTWINVASFRRWCRRAPQPILVLHALRHLGLMFLARRSDAGDLLAAVLAIMRAWRSSLQLGLTTAATASAVLSLPEHLVSRPAAAREARRRVIEWIERGIECALGEPARQGRCQSETFVGARSSSPLTVMGTTSNPCSRK